MNIIKEVLRDMGDSPEIVVEGERKDRLAQEFIRMFGDKDPESYALMFRECKRIRVVKDGSGATWYPEASIGFELEPVTA